MKIFLMPDGRPRPIWRVVLFIPPLVAAMVLSAYLSAMALVGISKALTFDLADLGGFERSALLSGMATVAATLAVTWLFLRGVDRTSFRSLGFWFYAGWGKELGIGLLMGVAMNSAVVGVLVVTGDYRFSLLDQPPFEVVVGLAINFVALALPAAGEEFLFRGYVFQRLSESWGVVAAATVLSALFGMAHLSNPSANWLTTVNIFFAGLILAALYWKTRALWLPIGFHFAWNYIMAAVYSVPVSGLVVPRRIFEVEITGPDWWSGGAFGPEQSILTVVVIIIGLIWLWRTDKIRVSGAQRKALESHPTEGKPE